MNAVLSTKGRRGKITKRISVYSNDPETPRYELTLKGEIVTDVNLTPSHISFRDVLAGAAATETFTIEVLNPKQVTVASVTSPDERFTLKQQESSEGKSTWEIRFRGTEDKGRITTNVTIALDGSDAPAVQLPIRVNVVGNIRYPQHVYLLKRDEAYQERTVWLESRVEGAAFKVTGVEDPDNNLRFKVKRESPTKTMITINSKDPGRALDQPLNGTIRITTNDKKDAELEMKYTLTAHRSPAHRRRALESRRKEARTREVMKQIPGSRPKKPEGAASDKR